MSDYLKDKMIPFHTIGKTEIAEINRELVTIIKEIKSAQPQDGPLVLLYTLRYDGMGIVRHDFQEIQDCFDRAKKVERLIFELVDPTKRKQIQLRFELLEPLLCQLLVADDDGKWVESIFNRLSSRLELYRNHNGVLRHSLAELFIQLVGVVSGFSVCLIVASILSPYLKVQHSFFVLFIGLLLVFSNLWTFILFLIRKVRDMGWPATSFKKKPLGLWGQTFLSIIITAILMALLSWAWLILEKASSLIIK